MNHTAENKMGVMPVGRLLFTMSAPMVASMLFQALYNVVDSVFVARLGQDAMNAVSLAFPVQTLMIAFSVGTGVGMSALLSRSLGMKDQEGADRAANTGLFMYFLGAIGFALIGLLLTELFFRMQTANEAIIRYGTQYLTVCLCCSLALFAQMSVERLLQSTGRTHLSMITQIIGALINMCLDPILIFGLFGFPRLEVMGAAVATIFGQSISAVVGFTLNHKYNPEVHLRRKLFRFHRLTVREIYRIGVPSIIMQSIGSLLTFCLNRILIGFTEAATAVFGAYYKIQSFVFLPVFGMNGAIVPILSYNYGAGLQHRLKETARISILSAVTIMSIGCLLFECFPNTLLGIFSPTAEMLEVGVPAMRIIGSHFPLAGFCIVAGSICQALGKPLYAMVTSICRQLVILLPAAYLLSLSGQLNLVWLAFPIAECIALFLNAFFLRKTFRGIRVPTALSEER